MTYEGNPQYRRKNIALAEIADLVPGFCESTDTIDKKSFRMLSFLRKRVPREERINTAYVLQLKKILQRKTYIDVAQFDQYICSLRL